MCGMLTDVILRTNIVNSLFQLYQNDWRPLLSRGEKLSSIGVPQVKGAVQLLQGDQGLLHHEVPHLKIS